MAQTAPLAMMVSGTAGRDAERLPAGRGIRVNHGRPVVSVCQDADTGCLHLASVRSSFAIEKPVDVDPAQLPTGGDFRRARRVKGLRIRINSQHTGTVAESYFGEVEFRGTVQ